MSFLTTFGLFAVTAMLVCYTLKAEAIREKRARIVKAGAELEASIKLTQGAKEREESPIALELKRMKMLSEIGIDNNTTTIVLVPSDFTFAAKSFTERVAQKKPAMGNNPSLTS